MSLNTQTGTPLLYLPSVFIRDGEHIIFMCIRLTFARSRLVFYSAKLAIAIANNDTRGIARYTYYVSIYQGRSDTLEAILPSHIPPYQVFDGSTETLKASDYYVNHTKNWEQSQRDELDAIIDEFMPGEEEE